MKNSESVHIQSVKRREEEDYEWERVSSLVRNDHLRVAKKECENQEYALGTYALSLQQHKIVHLFMLPYMGGQLHGHRHL